MSICACDHPYRGIWLCACAGKRKRLITSQSSLLQKSVSDAGTRTRVARVKAEYPNQLDYIGTWTDRATKIPISLFGRRQQVSNRTPHGCLARFRKEKNASAGNRTRVTSMATMYSTTKPLMLVNQVWGRLPIAKFAENCGQKRRRFY